VGQDFYPVVAATHLAWIASLFFLMPPQAPVLWPLIYYYLALQLVRCRVIASLGRYGPTASSPLPMRQSSPAAPIAISATRITP
jgi:methyltransferase